MTEIPCGFPTDEEWTPDMIGAADDEGWNLFDCSSDNGRTQLCCYEVAEKFSSDDDAWEYVVFRALEGSSLHLTALRLVKKYNEIEWGCICKAFPRAKELDV